MSEVLIAGSTGGREHALGLALANEGEHTVAFTHGGNAGTRQVGENLALTDLEQIADYAVSTSKDLVVIGPEAPLVAGLANQLRERGVATFGPNANGARLEASKAFTAEFCDQFGIRQPEYFIVDEKFDPMLHQVFYNPQEYVLKADGLAGGKGVILPETDEEALETVKDMMTGKLFGDAGKRMVVQRRLKQTGPEVSALYVLDGKDFTLLPLAQDHKRLLDGDQGPNTGGMGAYTPVTFEDEDLIDDLKEIGDSLVYGMKMRGMDYHGVAFVGAMRDVDNGNRPSVLEINIRFGDPETQVVLAALGQAGINAYDLLSSAAHGSLDKSLRGEYLGNAAIGAALTVCLAAEGYPEAPVKGKVIYGLDEQYEGVTIHHGGTKLGPDTKQITTSGGRVLYVTATGETIDEAASRAYGVIDDGVYFDGMQYRTDIGWQARS